LAIDARTGARGEEDVDEVGARVHRHLRQQSPTDRVGVFEVEGRVEHERGEGRVDHAHHRVAVGRERGASDLGGGEFHGEPGSGEQIVACTQREVERRGDAQDQVASGT
jgi:hypothetical protein